MRSKTPLKQQSAIMARVVRPSWKDAASKQESQSFELSQQSKSLVSIARRKDYVVRQQTAKRDPNEQDKALIKQMTDSELGSPLSQNLVSLVKKHRIYGNDLQERKHSSLIQRPDMNTGEDEST